MSSLFKYGTSEPFEYLDQGVPFLRIADLQKYRFGEKDLKFISQEAAKQQQANVNTGDVLMTATTWINQQLEALGINLSNSN